MTVVKLSLLDITCTIVYHTVFHLTNQIGLYQIDKSLIHNIYLIYSSTGSVLVHVYLLIYFPSRAITLLKFLIHLLKNDYILYMPHTCVHVADH